MATGKYLLGAKAPVFGVAYSNINTSGLLKGVSLSPAGITKLAGKLLEDGHATTFMIEGGNITMTGMGYDGWVFYRGKLAETDFARSTPNANTYVYYTDCTKEDVEKYKKIRKDLKGVKDATYHELWPNLLGKTRYENCISSSPYDRA